MHGLSCWFQPENHQLMGQPEAVYFLFPEGIPTPAQGRHALLPDLFQSFPARVARKSLINSEQKKIHYI
jgi:hypothetical protein